MAIFQRNVAMNQRHANLRKKMFGYTVLAPEGTPHALEQSPSQVTSMFHSMLPAEAHQFPGGQGSAFNFHHLGQQSGIVNVMR
jgi:hypothetical protein